MLSEFPQFVETLESNQRLEMEKIHAYASSEIQRQNSLANKTKNSCEEKLTELQGRLEEVMSSDLSHCRIIESLSTCFKVQILHSMGKCSNCENANAEMKTIFF